MAEIRKNILGRWEVKYNCPKCSVRLTSSLMEAGEVDSCPDCGTRFKVPGLKQRQEVEQQQTKERAAKEEAQKIATEERRLAAEERRLAAEERNLILAKRSAEEDEERRKRQLIVKKQEDDQRRNELASLNPRPIRGEIVDSHALPTDAALCPFCAETISLHARKCKHCGELLDVTLRAAAEAQRASAGVQIVNVVHGGSAHASANADAYANAEAKIENGSCLQNGCGCLILIIVIGAIASALGGCAVVL